jgi:hypothetical protein
MPDIYPQNGGSSGGVSSVNNSDGTLAVSPNTGSVTVSIANSAALPGNPTTTTANSGDATTKVATTAFVAAAVSGAGGGDVASVTAADGTLTITPNTGAVTAKIPTSVALPGSPTTTTQATTDASTKIATTAYVTTAVTNAIAGVNPAVAVMAASTGALPNVPTYSNGASGVGATLTANANNVTLVLDAYTPLLNDRLLIKNQAAPAQNGIFTVTQLAGSILPWVLTRAADYDQSSDMNQTGAIPVVNGTVNGTTSWLLTSTIVNVGVDSATYTEFSINPSTIVTTSRTVSTGTGLSGGGALSSNLTLTNVGVTSNVSGNGISVSAATGAVTITNTGVLSVNGATGVVTVGGLPQGFTGSPFKTRGAFTPFANMSTANLLLNFSSYGLANTAIIRNMSGPATPNVVKYGYTVADFSAAGTANQEASIRANGSGNQQVQWAGGPALSILVVTSSAIANMRMGFGWNDNSNNNDLLRSSTPGSTNNAQTVGFQYDTSASDTTWKAVTSSASSTTRTDTLITVATGTAYQFYIDMNTSQSQIDFYINGTKVASNTTNLPTTTTPLGLILGCRSLSSTYSEFFLGSVYYESS